MRLTRTIDPEDLSPTRWVTIPQLGTTVVINAALGLHIRVKVASNCTIEPPLNGVSGQAILLRIEWTASATVTLHSSWTQRGTTTLPTASGSVFYVTAVYDEELGVWEAVGIPDLSGTYDVAGAASIAQSNSEAYTDAAIDGLVIVYLPIPTVGSPLALGEGVNITTGATTGSSFGASASQKISFHGVAPTAQSSGWSTMVTGARKTLDDTITHAELLKWCSQLLVTLYEKGILGT